LLLENQETGDASKDREGSEMKRRRNDQPSLEKALANLVLLPEAQDLDAEQLIKRTKMLKLVCKAAGGPPDEASTSNIPDK
jgi:hypothetical protein